MPRFIDLQWGQDQFLRLSLTLNMTEHCLTAQSPWLSRKYAWYDILEMSKQYMQIRKQSRGIKFGLIQKACHFTRGCLEKKERKHVFWSISRLLTAYCHFVIPPIWIIHIPLHKWCFSYSWITNYYHLKQQLCHTSFHNRKHYPPKNCHLMKHSFPEKGSPQIN